MNEGKLPLSADAVNAVVTALGAVVFATVRRLPPSERKGFADDLAVMAQACSDADNTTAEMLLIDLHRAAVGAAGNQG